MAQDAKNPDAKTLDAKNPDAASRNAAFLAAYQDSRVSGNGTFETEGVESFYKPIPEYEGAHRYDPNFEWKPEEERRVVRRVSDT